jgi:hypothetical protein
MTDKGPFEATGTDVRPCQVCGEQCGDEWTAGGYANVTISMRRESGTEELAYLCLRCFAEGILHAARLARIATAPVPDPPPLNIQSVPIA